MCVCFIMMALGHETPMDHPLRGSCNLLQERYRKKEGIKNKGHLITYPVKLITRCREKDEAKLP